jgi:hypothetical protein
MALHRFRGPQGALGNLRLAVSYRDRTTLGPAYLDHNQDKLPTIDKINTSIK